MCEKGLNADTGKLKKPAHCFIAAFLIEERQNTESEWADYIKLLPQDVQEYPIRFKEEHLKLLEGSLFLSQLEEDRKDMKHDYEMICNELPEFKDACSFDHFVYNFILILSRVFTMVIKEEKTIGMLPLIDMPNHSYQNNLKW